MLESRAAFVEAEDNHVTVAGVARQLTEVVALLERHVGVREAADLGRRRDDDLAIATIADGQMTDAGFGAVGVIDLADAA